nr:HPr family phosphocarrier protein [Janibacter melonis]
MPSTKVVVASAVGLPARPAGIIAERAEALDAEVTLAVDGEEPVDAASALLIMTLGAEKGTEVTVESDSQEAVDVIADLVRQDLDAE